MADEDYDPPEEESEMLDNCPNCGEEYDEIDHEYQICHFCGYNAVTKQNKVT